ncbi:SMI1/KNR4 family protein [Haloactinospora alba]|uniref:SMI1/KNR4 family protein n=1 Tax=Haloactinospora alba TaxID=405555 RepID=UPI00114FB097|nr:SMI1/KNR4 family protein [Haloactinospora alba]
MHNEHKEIDYLIEKAISYGFASRESIKGCTDEQIEELQNQNKDILLPGDYVYFMKKAGGYPFKYFSVELDIRSAICAVDIAEEFVEEAPDFDLSQKLFIGNYKFDVIFFFKKGSSALYSFDEVEEEKAGDSFTSFLYSKIESFKKDMDGAERLKRKMEN